METTEKNNRDESRREQGRGGKKPFYKHYRHRPKNQNKIDQPKDSAERGGDINTSRPRYDIPPTEQQSAASFTVAQINHESGRDENRRLYHQRHRNERRNRHPRQCENTEIVVAHEQALPDEFEDASAAYDNRNGCPEGEHDNHKRRKRHQPRRSGSGDNVTETAHVDALKESFSPESEDISEPMYTEYIATAGSLDSEIVDELNSVSADELENIELSENNEPSESTPEVDLPKHEIVGIRFKTGGKIYYFAPGDHKCLKGEPVIVETSRGLEYGICDIPNRMVTEREIVLPLRPIVRKATDEDIEKHAINTAKEQEALAVCSQKILDHNLGMKLIDVEYAFDGSKLLFYFTADGRVDFRELVKDLAAVFRTRIELRQIGIRDETKLLGGIGICGRPFCCKTFLSDFVQVSIKMAKEQNLSLNSAKISGACGRLMCCLRYEYNVYQEEIKKTPKVDQIVETPDGEGTVIEVQPLAGLVRVRFGTKADMITPKVYHRDDVKVIGGKGVKPKDQ